MRNDTFPSNIEAFCSLLKVRIVHDDVQVVDLHTLHKAKMAIPQGSLEEQLFEFAEHAAVVENGTRDEAAVLFGIACPSGNPQKAKKQAHLTP
jgi:hypothetical protein